MYSKVSWQEDKRRKSIFMLSSLALHLLLFIILHLAGMGIGKAEHRGEFDLQAIKVVNMIAKAKDAITRKTKSRSKQSQKRPKAGRRKNLPEAKLRTVAKHRTSAQEVAEKAVLHQPDLPTHEVTERTLERQMTLAKLVITKENQLTIDKKIFAEQSKKVDLKQEKLLQKKFEPRKKMKPKKRQIKTPDLLKNVVKKPPAKTIKPVEDADLEIVRKKIVVPVAEPERKQFAQVTVRESAPTQKRKRQEKQKTAQARSTAPKKQITPTKQVHTPQEVTTTPTRKLAFNVSPKSTQDRSAPKKKSSSATKLEDAPTVEVDLPTGEKTSEPLYKLEGTVDGEATNAFLTVNDVTQILSVVNGKFEAEIAMVKGNNKVEVLVFSSRGGVGKNSFNLFFSPLPGAPFISLDSPENGRQGMSEGDEVLVLGTVDDETIQRAILFLNGIPLQPMPVINGVFKRKVFLPNTRATTFRVMAKNKHGVVGYSAIHTVVSGRDIDLLNPRPY